MNSRVHDSYKVVIMFILIIVCCFLTYYFHFILGTGVIFTHFFYIPIILAALWWRRKGLAVPIFLALMLIFSDVIQGKTNFSLNEDVIRALLFMIVGAVTTILSEMIAEKEVNLLESETKYRTLTENVNLGVYRNTVGAKGRFIEVNPAVVSMFGYKEKKELLEKNVSDLYENDEDRKIFSDKLLKYGSLKGEELNLKRKDGTNFVGAVSAVAVKDKNGNVKYFDGIIEDITQRKEMEEINAKLAAIVEGTDDAIIGKDLDATILSWNPGAEKIYGYSAPEVIGKNLRLLIPDDHPNELSCILEKIRNGEIIHHFETVRVRKDGNSIDVSLTLSPIKDSSGRIIGASTIARDITERKKTEKQLQKSLKDKEILMKEIHHRVKNNLMVFSSLLNLQSKFIRDEVALDVFRESQNRAKTMAIIHEKLYRSSDLKRIDFGEYIRDLSNLLFRTYATDSSRIMLNIDVEDVMLDVDISIPLGLILNELLSNSLKYAFPDGRKGDINIEFYHEEDDLLSLIVKDNVVGFPENIDFKKTESLGLQLVNMLTEQVNGDVQLKRKDGTKFKINFKDKIME